MQAHFNGHKIAGFLIRSSACDHWVLQPRRPPELPSPEGRDICELCHEYSRHHGKFYRLQEHLQSEAVHSKVRQQTHLMKEDVKCIQALISLFTFNSDSGISSETSSTYLEMRPSRLAELPTVESSEGKLVISLRFKLLKMIRSVCWSQDFIPIWFFSRPCLWGEWWLAAGYWWPAQIFLPSSSGPRLFGQEKCEFNTPLTN